MSRRPCAFSYARGIAIVLALSLSPAAVQANPPSCRIAIGSATEAMLPKKPPPLPPRADLGPAIKGLNPAEDVKVLSSKIYNYGLSEGVPGKPLTEVMGTPMGPPKPVTVKVPVPKSPEFPNGFKIVNAPEKMIAPQKTIRLGPGANGEFATMPGKTDFLFQLPIPASPPARSIKVYLTLPEGEMQARLPGILEDVAKTNNAGMKVAANPSQRVEKVVVYFENPEEAAKFAKTMESKLAGVKGDKPPFAVRAGKTDAPVFLGIDDAAAGSHRQIISDKIAQSMKECGCTDSATIAQKLKDKGINPDDWLPNDDLGDRLRKALAAP